MMSEVKIMHYREISPVKAARTTLFLLAVGLLTLCVLGCGQKEEHHGEGGPAKEEAGLSGELIDGGRLVKVEAFKHGFAPDPIVVGLGEKVRLELESRDVTHGFGIQEYGIDETIPRGKKVEAIFLADKPGTFHIHCTVFCGPGHGDMHGTLLVREKK